MNRIGDGSGHSAALMWITVASWIVMVFLVVASQLQEPDFATGLPTQLEVTLSALADIVLHIAIVSTIGWIVLAGVRRVVQAHAGAK